MPAPCSFSKMNVLRQTSRIIGETLPDRCCWRSGRSWDKILPSFVSDKGGLRPWLPLRVSIPTSSSKREGSTLQCPSVGIHLRQKRWLSAITDHPSDHWSLLAGDRWSHNDHSERLCAVGAAGQGDFYLLTGHEAGYLTWNNFDDQARLTPQPNLLLENVASGRILGSWGAWGSQGWEPGSLDHQSKRPSPITTAFRWHLKQAKLRNGENETKLTFNMYIWKLARFR